MSGYDHNQRNATRLVCVRCQRPYDVTNTTSAQAEAFVCVSCSGAVMVRDGLYRSVRSNSIFSATDVTGFPMEGGDTGP